MNAQQQQIANTQEIVNNVRLCFVKKI